MTPWRRRRPLLWLAACLLIATLGGCAILREFQPAVALEAMTPGEYIALQRGDVVTTTIEGLGSLRNPMV